MAISKSRSRCEEEPDTAMVSARVDYLAARYVRLSIWLFAGTRRKEGSPELLRLKQRLNLSPQEVVEPLCKVVEAGDRRLIDVK